VTAAPPSEPPIVAAPPSPWAPLSQPVFRMLWSSWLAANICMWMNDVAAAWLMTSLSDSAVMVALVQTASTLPVFMLGVPSGALADILDRRRYFMATQFWVAGVAIVLCVASVSGVLSASLLLLLTFANGIGLAMRWPVFAAIVPELVPRVQLPAALALNGIAMNASRIIGPVIAGALLAAAGSAYVFLLNALLSLASAFVIMRWRSAQKLSALPGERFLGAIRVGLQYVAQSPRMHVALLRVALFFLQSTALLALLPLIAKTFQDGDASTFTMLLAGMGAGAIIAAMAMPRLRQVMTPDDLVRSGTLLHALATLAVAFAPNLYVALPAMVAAGIAWICVANALTVAAQLALPDWVRARGMSIYQMALMGGAAVGAALWGQVATMTDLRTSLMVASVGGPIAWLMTRRWRLDHKAEEDLSPAHAWDDPVTAFPVLPESGPVLVTVTYQIDPARADEFVALMDESRRSRLRHGVLAWELFRDTAHPGRYIEYIIDESWVEHLRRFERMTSSEVALRERKLAFHLGAEPPVVSRFVAEPRASR
jgi:MFS family permease